MISEIVADLRAHGATAVIDHDFARDIGKAFRLTASHGCRRLGSSARLLRPDRR